MFSFALHSLLHGFIPRLVLIIYWTFDFVSFFFCQLHYMKFNTSLNWMERKTTGKCRKVKLTKEKKNEISNGKDNTLKKNQNQYLHQSIFEQLNRGTYKWRLFLTVGHFLSRIPLLYKKLDLFHIFTAKILRSAKNRIRILWKYENLIIIHPI